MKKYNRIFVIVLDSLGIGAMPDSERFGDTDVDTFGHILERMQTLDIPNLTRLGMLNLHCGGQMQPAAGANRQIYAAGRGSNGKEHDDRPLGDDGHQKPKSRLRHSQSTDFHRSSSLSLRSSAEKRS